MKLSIDSFPITASELGYKDSFVITCFVETNRLPLDLPKTSANFREKRQVPSNNGIVMLKMVFVFILSLVNHITQGIIIKLIVISSKGNKKEMTKIEL